MLPAGLALMLNACAELAPLPAEEQPQAPQASQGVPDPHRTMMLNVLAGEIAGHQGNLGAATAHLLQALKFSDDPELAERATRVALYAQNPKAALAAIQRWVELAPANQEAQLLLGALLLRDGQKAAAMNRFRQLLKGPTQERAETLQGVIAALASEPDKAAVLLLFKELAQEHPKLYEVWLAQAALSLDLRDHAHALMATGRLLKLKPWHNRGVMLRAKALTGLERTDEAIKLLSAASARQPKNAELRLALGRVLLDAHRIEQAISEFERLLKAVPNDPDLLFTVGLLSLEIKRHDATSRYLGRLLATGKRDDDAHYYLGRLAQQRRDWNTALEHYGQVRDGNHLLEAKLAVPSVWLRQGRLSEARQRFAELRQEQPKQAIKILVAESEALHHAGDDAASFAVLDEALNAGEKDPELLYAHALAAERMDKIDLLEKNLRQLLENKPDHAHALNALGYTLADRTTRYVEALPLIERALTLAPEEPAILDSMGWVQYRLGNHDLALKYLRRALARLMDDEIAAHLGEVLWVTGQKAEARRVWSRALEHEPESRILREVKQRLDP